MRDISEKLLTIVDESSTRFKALTEDEWNKRIAPDKWSKKEILGHLIDSAANNHQIFVRVQFEDDQIITYNQNKWMESQSYQNADIKNLIKLWRNYNKHLAYIIKVIPEEHYNRKCDIRIDQPVTLQWLVNDYALHLEHHVKQII
jgi:hypothetical protein